MVESEVVITFESLFELLRREKYRPELQKLDENFYANALSYLKEKEAILESQETRDSIFAAEEVDKTRMQLRNVQKILKEIYEKREAKVVQLALFNSRNRSVVHNESALLPEELSIFESVKGVLDQHREGILHNLLKSSMPELPFKKEKPLKTTCEINKEERGLVKVRILAAIPEFVGPDMEVYGPFDESQVAELPKEISEVLAANRQAEIEDETNTDNNS
jgi:hypothetical protein